MNYSFTICSSYYSRESKALLELNCELVTEKNPGKELPWVVADNTPPEYSGEKLHDERFAIVPGSRELEPKHIFGYHKGSAPSCEHGTVLNSFYKYVKTRFALILDNDFFIIRDNWIQEVLAHMDKNGLTFFGSPFHPRYYHKLRYFPCPQLFFIDTQKIHMSELNFLPRCDFKRAHSFSQEITGQTQPSLRLKFNPAALLRKVARAILGAPDKYEYHYSPFSVRGRGMVEGSKDTVTHILEKYRDNPSTLHECIQPVFKPWQDGGRGGLYYIANRAIEFFLPDTLCFVPKRKGYFNTCSFKDRGYYDVQGVDKWWEELLWLDRPFGFHLRQHRSVTDRGLDENIAVIKTILKSFS